MHQGKGREDDRKQDGKTRFNETFKRTGLSVGENMDSLMWIMKINNLPVSLHNGKRQRKRRRVQITVQLRLPNKTVTLVGQLEAHKKISLYCVGIFRAVGIPAAQH